MNQSQPKTPKPGDLLRNEAARLLAARFGQIKVEQRADGKKVDAYFEYSEFGKRRRYYVEAKDYAGPLTRQQCVHIWSDYSGIIEKNQPANLLIVSRFGLTTDADVYVNVEQKFLSHQTIYEIQNDALGLGEYIRDLSSIFKDGGLSEYYVEARARRIEYQGRNRLSDVSNEICITKEITNWIDSEDYTPIAVLGGYGAGKSSLAKRIASYQASRCLEDPLERQPILIPLGRISRFSDVTGILAGMFSEDFKVPGFSPSVFFELNRSGRLLILLDGFDEMKHAMSKSDFINQVKDLNRFVEGNSKVILFGRPTAFLSREEHIHVLRGVRSFGEDELRIAGWPQFNEYDLEEFGPEERVQFVKRYLTYIIRHQKGNDDFDIDERTTEIEFLISQQPEVFGKPVHSKILVEMGADPNFDLSRLKAGVDRWTLYDYFFRSLVERECERNARSPLGPEARIQFLQELAYWLWTEKGGQTSFNSLDIPDGVFELLQWGDMTDIDILRREYLTGSTLEKKFGDVYFFSHRSFAEFFVASRMAAKPPSPKEHGTYCKLFCDGVAAFLKEAPPKGPITTWANNLTNAQGEIYVDYLALIAQKSGGRGRLDQSLAKSNLWNSVMATFDADLELHNGSWSALQRCMTSSNNTLFALAYELAQYVSSAKKDGGMFLNIAICSLFLRVFRHAEVDEYSGRVLISDEYDDAKKLLQRSFSEFTPIGDDLEFRFNSASLSNECSELLRRNGFHIQFRPPAGRVLIADMNIRLSDLVSYFEREEFEMVRNYFRRHPSLSAIVTRSAVKRRSSQAIR